MFEDQEIQRLTKLFSAFGSSTRLRIIKLVKETERPLHIKAVASALKKDYATIYRHVGVLEKSGVIGVYEVGRSRVIYLKKSENLKEFILKAQKML
ncbi:MAG: winged helix-turn-helix domain-containing protein [Candidatus Bathyarchaeota archaeon]